MSLQEARAIGMNIADTTWVRDDKDLADSSLCVRMPVRDLVNFNTSTSMEKGCISDLGGRRNCQRRRCVPVELRWEDGHNNFMSAEALFEAAHCGNRVRSQTTSRFLLCSDSGNRLRSQTRSRLRVSLVKPYTSISLSHLKSGLKTSNQTTASAVHTRSLLDDRDEETAAVGILRAPRSSSIMASAATTVSRQALSTHDQSMNS